MDSSPLEAGGRLTRAFVAVAIPPEVREDLARYLARCAAAAPDFRWAPPSNLHLTLRFCGGLAAEVLEALRAELRGVRAQGFDAALGAPGAFGGRRPRVIWLGVEHGGDELNGLAGLVEAACRAAGLEAEGRPFRAHLTLARARDRFGAPAPELPPAPEPRPWHVESFALYESRLGRGPAVYTVIEEFPLSPAR